MTKQVQDAYIVAATRTPIGKAPQAARSATCVRTTCWCARSARRWRRCPASIRRRSKTRSSAARFPEAEQGLNMARDRGAAGRPAEHHRRHDDQPLLLIGITAVAMAADRIRVGEADVMMAGGAESMSMVPMMGHKPSINAHIFEKDENVGIAYGMGLTAEKVPQQWKVTREDAGRSSRWSRTAAHRRAAGRRIQGRDDAGRDHRAIPDLATGQIDDQDPHRRASTKARAPIPSPRRWPSCGRCSRPRAA